MHPQAKNDQIITQLLMSGRLRADTITGLVYSAQSNNPSKAIGSKTKKGYLRACVSIKGKRVALLLHRVVWIAANGIPSPEFPQINHKDTVKTHNYLSNLELQNNAGNMRHASANSLLYGPRGERAPRGKLTAPKVLTIRRLARQGVRPVALSKQFGIDPVNIRRIIRRDTWAWLAKEAVNPLYVRADQPLEPFGDDLNPRETP